MDRPLDLTTAPVDYEGRRPPHQRRRFRRDRLRWDAEVPVPLWSLVLILCMGLVQLGAVFVIVAR